MIAETTLQIIINKLNEHGFLRINIGESAITLRSNRDRSKFLLSCLVYAGDEYIPDSVRKYVLRNPEIHKYGLKAYLKIYEKIFEVYLHYHGNLDDLTINRLSDLLEDFGAISVEIREILDENDRNDLIHVRQK